MSDERRVTLKKKKEGHYTGKKKYSKRTVIALFIVLAAVPAVICAGHIFAYRQYYLTSCVILVLALMPFFVTLGKRKPKAREIVTIVVMSLIAVLARAAFVWLPHYKPLTAIVIIAGASLGAEAGFLTGALSGFISNFIFGHGPWSPWQMFAFGLAGLIAGLLCSKGILKKDRFSMCIFGGAVVIAVVGPVLDVCSLFTMTEGGLSPEIVVDIFKSGLPANAVHALSTAVTLLILAKFFTEKLDRIKLKYGMMEEQ